ncbi:MAG: MAPEG family protein [Pseudomonadota bacterium]
MIAPSITPLFAGLLTLVYLFLTFTVIRERGRLSVSLGDGGDPAFERKIRGHGNFVETVPLALLLMVLAELSGAGAGLLYTIGGLLLAGRLVHAWCFIFTAKNMPARVAGMVMTILAIVIAAGSNLSLAL